jgi:uncharacterized membrane protein YhiD involved in acid resistance
VVVLVINTVLREVSRTINATPVSNADLVREYVLTIVCREADEIHIRTAISNSMYSTPLSFQSLTSEDVEHETGRIRVTATLKLHPKTSRSSNRWQVAGAWKRVCPASAGRREKRSRRRSDAPRAGPPCQRASSTLHLQ